ncbi:DoxX family protein [Mucilaginibacter robiniae]|uniref:DoxX family protein n=1 Tax=Mucilaginibacter robiniae TaxID=2728022 RepID=A0A7L5DXM1_9SPHI|nr:DoxX family protein [Mucilaginibacter robiniae]QJD95850.1 DoxX family protein [Mucilaginibacter robiniae]
MKIIMIIVRTLMGLLLLFASVSFFFKLMPMPQATGQAKVYNDGLAVVGIMNIVKVLELLCGLAFVTGRFVTLAVVVIFPILINIVLFHAVVAPSGLTSGALLLVGDLFLAYYYRRNYVSLFAIK